MLHIGVGLMTGGALKVQRRLVLWSWSEKILSTLPYKDFMLLIAQAHLQDLLFLKQWAGYTGFSSTKIRRSPRGEV